MGEKLKRHVLESALLSRSLVVGEIDLEHRLQRRPIVVVVRGLLDDERRPPLFEGEDADAVAEDGAVVELPLHRGPGAAGKSAHGAPDHAADA